MYLFVILTNLSNAVLHNLGTIAYIYIFIGLQNCLRIPETSVHNGPQMFSANVSWKLQEWPAS